MSGGIEKGIDQMPEDKDLKKVFTDIIEKTDKIDDKGTNAFENFLKQWKNGIVFMPKSAPLLVKTESEKSAFLHKIYERGKGEVLKNKAEFDKKYGKTPDATTEDFLRQGLTDIESILPEEIPDPKEFPDLSKFLKAHLAAYKKRVTRGATLISSIKQQLENKGFERSETLVFDKEGKFQTIESTPDAERDFETQLSKHLGRKPTNEELKKAWDIKKEYILSMYTGTEGMDASELKADREDAFPGTSKKFLNKLPQNDEKWIKFLVTADHPVYDEIVDKIAVTPENQQKLIEHLNFGKIVQLKFSPDKSPILMKKSEKNKELFDVYYFDGSTKISFEADEYFTKEFYKYLQSDQEKEPGKDQAFLPYVFALGKDYESLRQNWSEAAEVLKNEEFVRKTYKESVKEIFGEL